MVSLSFQIGQKMYKFKNGDLVRFNWSGVNGDGYICGLASIPAPIIGAMWIIEGRDWCAKGTTYPYSCFVLPECALHRVIDR